jgi:hypothetical protein
MVLPTVLPSTGKVMTLVGMPEQALVRNVESVDVPVPYVFVENAAKWYVALQASPDILLVYEPRLNVPVVEDVEPYDTVVP